MPQVSSNDRNGLVVICLLLTFAASVFYDTRLIISLGGLRSAVGAAVVACLGAVFLLSRYPIQVIQPAFLASWPLHFFTICFFGVSWCFHGGAQLGSIIAYTIVAYATYLLVPVCLLLDRSLFAAFSKIVAIGSALLAIPSFAGAMGVDSFFGFPLSNKYAYSSFSGIIASGGVFEHAEGHALQMAVGLLCCLYNVRKSPGPFFAICFAMVLAGLVVSQGRGAIFGVAIAGVYCVLPGLIRRSSLLFIGSLAFGLMLPFLIWPLLASVPGMAGYLRLERGLSGRDVAWQYAGNLIEEKPWTGHGFETSGALSEEGRKQLRKSGYSGAGTTFHNTFITRTVELGLITSIVYTLLYVLPLIRICRPTPYHDEQALVRSLVLVILTASIFRDYNIGGVRSTAMMTAIFLGLANLWPLAAAFERASQKATDHGTLREKSTGAAVGQSSKAPSQPLS